MTMFSSLPVIEVRELEVPLGWFELYLAQYLQRRELDPEEPGENEAA